MECTICLYLHRKYVIFRVKGTDGNTRLCDLYSKARKTYSKGYATREMIKTLDLSKIRSKRLDILKELEDTLGVNM